MRILITEDDPNKLQAIVQYVSSLGVSEDQIVTASNMAEFTTKFDDTIDVCVIDLLLPAYKGAEPCTSGIGVLQVVEELGAESSVRLLAISAYTEQYQDLRSQFERRGCLLVDFAETATWQSALKLLVVQAQGIDRFDFVIFCALRAERAPYTGLQSLNGTPVNKEGHIRYDVVLHGKRGTIIELPRMGLVDAAATVAASIQKYQPKVVAMSGICAGFPGRASLGQLLISELAYEYQSGKWTGEGFSVEPYQVPVSEFVRSTLRQLIDDEELVTRLERDNRFERPSTKLPPKLAAFTSGSAVVAADQKRNQVSGDHRKVSGLDMEIYAVHRAAHLAPRPTDVICAKVVVDMAGGDKDDRLHGYGAFVSANFVIEALAAYFAAGRSSAR